MRNNGLFVVFEGIDKSGKSTLSSLVEESLNERGIKAFRTYEPGDSDTGKLIRRILLNPDLSLTPTAEYLLFVSDRFEHLGKVILPKLEDGFVVLCDRFHYSTFAYQLYPFGNQSEEVRHIMEADTLLCKPLFERRSIDRVYFCTRRVGDIPAFDDDAIENRGPGYLSTVARGFEEAFCRYGTGRSEQVEIKFENGLEKNLETVVKDIVSILEIRDPMGGNGR